MEWFTYLTLLRGALHGEYQPRGLIEDADCVLAFSMGYGVVDGEATPGTGNGELAMYIYANFAQSSLPILAQEEIAVALEAMDYPGEILRFCQLGEKTTTRHVAMQMIAEMKDPDRDYEDPILVASARHAARADLIVSWFRLDPILTENLPQALDPASAQWRTRNPVNWMFWELCSWSHHFLHGLI